MRLTARGDDDDDALALLADEERTVRTLIEKKLGDIIFGVDDQSMEDVVAAQLTAARSHPGRGRVADRRTHRQSTGERPGRLDVVSRRRRELRLAGEVRRARACPKGRS